MNNIFEAVKAEYLKLQDTPWFHTLMYNAAENLNSRLEKVEEKCCKSPTKQDETSENASKSDGNLQQLSEPAGKSLSHKLQYKADHLDAIHFYFNEVHLGFAYKDDAGFYVYDFPNPPIGSWDAWTIRAVADKLYELNKPWQDIIDNDPAVNGSAEPAGKEDDSIVFGDWMFDTSPRPNDIYEFLDSCGFNSDYVKEKGDKILAHHFPSQPAKQPESTPITPGNENVLNVKSIVCLHVDAVIARVSELNLPGWSAQKNEEIRQGVLKAYDKGFARDGRPYFPQNEYFIQPAKQENETEDSVGDWEKSELEKEIAHTLWKYYGLGVEQSNDAAKLIMLRIWEYKIPEKPGTTQPIKKGDNLSAALHEQDIRDGYVSQPVQEEGAQQGKCTKPNCNCIEKEMQKQGTEFIKSYPCLAGNPRMDELKSKFKKWDSDFKATPESVKKTLERTYDTCDAQEKEIADLKAQLETANNGRDGYKQLYQELLNKERVSQREISSLKKSQKEAFNAGMSRGVDIIVVAMTVAAGDEKKVTAPDYDTWLKSLQHKEQ